MGEGEGEGGSNVEEVTSRSMLRKILPRGDVRLPVGKRARVVRYGYRYPAKAWLVCNGHCICTYPSWELERVMLWNSSGEIRL